MRASFLMAAVGVLAAASMASAGTVYVNPGSRVTATETAGRGEARYRMSSSNFDQGLGPDVGSASGRIVNEMGNSTSLNNAWFRYTLQFVAGQGYSMKMVNHGSSKTNAAGASHELVWRNDASVVNTGNTFKSANLLNGLSATSGAVHMLILTAQASSGAPSYMEWDQLAFSATGQTVVGTLTDMNAPPTAVQRIVSQQDFRTFDWQLDGWVRGSGATNGGESQKFAVNFKDATVTVIPLPTAGLMAGVGLVGFVGLHRRRSV
jgi:hypothetical protein